MKIASLRARDFFLNSLIGCSRLNSYNTHHSAIEMLDDVTMKWNYANDVRVAEVHAHNDAGVLFNTIPRRQVHCIAQSRFFPANPSPPHYYEMELMYVECV